MSGDSVIPDDLSLPEGGSPHLAAALALGAVSKRTVAARKEFSAKQLHFRSFSLPLYKIKIQRKFTDLCAVTAKSIEEAQRNFPIICKLTNEISSV